MFEIVFLLMACATANVIAFAACVKITACDSSVGGFDHGNENTLF